MKKLIKRNFIMLSALSLPCLSTFRSYFHLQRFALDLQGTQNKFKGYSSLSAPFELKKSYLYVNLYISLNHLYNFSEFLTEIKKCQLRDKTVYTVFVKVRYNQNQFFMMANQFGFTCSDLSSFKDLYDILYLKLQEYLGHYNLEGEQVQYIQVTFRQLNKHIYSNLTIDKDILNLSNYTEKKKIKQVIGIHNVDDQDLGEKLPTVLDNNLNIKEIKVLINNKSSNFLDLIKASQIKKNHPDNITHFDGKYKFYLIKNSID